MAEVNKRVLSLPTNDQKRYVKNVDTYLSVTMAQLTGVQFMKILKSYSLNAFGVLAVAFLLLRKKLACQLQ